MNELYEAVRRAILEGRGELDEGASRDFGSAIKKAEASRQRGIRKAARAVNKGQKVENAIRDHDLFSKDKDAILAHAASLRNKETELAETNPYAIGMAAAEKSTGDRPPLKKSTIVKAHRIAKKIKAIDEDSGIDPDLEAELKATRQTKKSVEDAKKKYGVKEEVELVDEGMSDTIKKGVKSLKRGLAGWEKGIHDVDTVKAATKTLSPDSKEAILKSKVGKGSPAELQQKLIKREIRSTNEEVEELDELSKATMGRYINKAATRFGPQGVTAGLKIAKDERSQKNFDTIGKRERGISTAVKKLTKEEADLVDEGIEVSTSNYEFSHGKKPKGSGGWMFSPHKNPDMKTQKDDVFSTQGSYTDAKKKAAAWAKDKGHRTIHALPEEVELDEAIDTMSDARIKYHATKGLPHGRYTPKEIKDEHERRRKSVPNYHAVKASLEEEVRPLDEARGRPKKDKGYTVHPITKELLHHDNPAHMARIKTLQKNGVLPKEKKEPSEHIINRMGQAATNMTGGQHIKYDNGKTHHVSNSLASRTLTHYRGLKPADKEKFQERIAQSHEDHLDALQGK